MIQKFSGPSLLAASLAFLIAASSFADEIMTDTSVGGGQVGGYFGPYDPIIDDPPLAYPPILPPDIDPSFQNYFMGRSTLGPLDTAMTTSERRAFFIYDTSSLVIPTGHKITGVSIELELLDGGTSVLANFTGDHEVVEFTSTPFGADDILDPDTAGIPIDDIWSTFGTSKPYGGFEILGPATPDPTLPGFYDIDLAGSIGDLADAISTGDEFIITARLATFDPDPIGPDAPPAIDPYEYVFGLTDVVSAFPTTPPPTLTITTSAIPEPSTYFLWGTGILFFIARRRRKPSGLTKN